MMYKIYPPPCSTDYDENCFMYRGAIYRMFNDYGMTHVTSASHVLPKAVVAATKAWLKNGHNASMPLWVYLDKMFGDPTPPGTDRSG